MTGTVLSGSVAVNDLSFLAFTDHALMMTSLLLDSLVALASTHLL